MAKKSSRSDQPASPTHLPSPDRRRTVRATTRKPATSPDAPVAAPDGFPSIARATGDEMQTQGDGHVTAHPTYEQIAEAAYHRYLQRGGHHGNDFDDWIDAERALRSRS